MSDLQLRDWLAAIVERAAELPEPEASVTAPHDAVDMLLEVRGFCVPVTLEIWPCNLGLCHPYFFIDREFHL